MLTKNNIKYINSLKYKKYRAKEHKFIIEGSRILSEIIKSIKNRTKIKSSYYEIEKIWYTEKYFIEGNDAFINEIKVDFENEVISEKEIKCISNVVNSPGIIALISYNVNQNISFLGPALILDDISNPGNLGAIFRSAEWFGINNIYLSSNTVDPYNPKVIQSSAGAHFHINSIVQGNIINFIKKYKDRGFKIISTSLNGIDVNKINENNNWCLILGNEAKGVSSEINKYADEIVTINKFGNVESLNVAMAGSIILSHLIN